MEGERKEDKWRRNQSKEREAQKGEGETEMEQMIAENEKRERRVRQWGR